MFMDKHFYTVPGTIRITKENTINYLKRKFLKAGLDLEDSIRRAEVEYYCMMVDLKKDKSEHC